jgi:hypothetical protein
MNTRTGPARSEPTEAVIGSSRGDGARGDPREGVSAASARLRKTTSIMSHSLAARHESASEHPC